MDWNKRYDVEGYFFGVAPNAFLVSHADRLEPAMRALAVADGEAKNGVWLAGQGLDVLSVDSSSVAQDKARALAADQGVTLTFACADLADWAWPEAAFDVVAVLHFHPPTAERPLFHRRYHDALKPGGLLIIEAFHPDQLALRTGGPAAIDRLVALEELQRDFATMDVITQRVVEVTLPPRHGRPEHRPGIVTQFAAYRTDEQ